MGDLYWIRWIAKSKNLAKVSRYTECLYMIEYHYNIIELWLQDSNGDCILENTILRATITKGGLLKSLIHKSSSK